MNDAWQQASHAVAAGFARGDFAAARTALADLVALRPDHADSWFNLGYCCRQLGDHAAALDAYATALANGLSGAEAAHVNRASILNDHFGQSEAAEAELARAIALNPDFLPAWLNLGGLHEDKGDAAAARSAYERAQQIAPTSGRAAARLAALMVLDGDAPGAVAALESQLRAGLARDDDGREILFALGNAMDAAARYDDAFRVFEAANQLSNNLRAPQQRYIPAAVEQLVDALCGLGPGEAAAEVTSDGPQPLFICGMFRSGSTVFEQLLARHPAIRAGGEQELIPSLVHGRLRPYPDRLQSVDAAELAAMRRDYLAHIAALPDSGEARFMTDKRPDNFLHIGLIKRLFPRARIIVTRRAPLDNLLSIYFLNFADTVNYSDALPHIVHYMRQYDRLMEHWSALYGDDICFVDYEATMADPDVELAKVLQWLGLDAAAGSEAGPAPVIRTPSNWQARGPLHRRSVDRWRNYERALAPHSELLAQLPAR